MGYGSRALQQLSDYYQKKFVDPDAMVQDPLVFKRAGPDGDLNQIVTPRKGLPPLLMKLNERPPENLDYFGVSFGLTPELFSFWKRAEFHPVYLRLTEVCFFFFFSIFNFLFYLFFKYLIYLFFCSLQ